MNRAKCLSYISSVAVTMTVASCGPSSHELSDAEAPSASSLRAPATTPEIAPLADPTVGDATRHWVQDAQLRALMKSLVAKTQRNLPNGLSQDPEDSQASEPRNAMGAARLADGLAVSAVRIPASVAATKMSEADRAGFQAEADTLRDLALRLGDAARANKVEQMQESLDGINATCISCHSRYRDYSGLLNSRQAAGN